MADSLPLPEIIQRYLNGEPIASIATDAQVTRYTIYNWLLTSLGDAQYEHLKAQAHARGIADADADLEQAEDMLAYNKAHARAKLRRLDFERRCPKLYGPKHEMEIDNKITVVINRLGPQQVVVGQGQGETVEGEVKDIKTLDVKTS
jgi:hypothetical protein